MYFYPARLEDDDNGTILVTFPDVPEAITYGLDRADALRRASGALESALSLYVDRGANLPAPSRTKSGKLHLVGISALADAKLQLYTALRASGIRKSELARRMGISKTNVDRLFDFGRSSRFDQIESAFRALGKLMVVSVRDAA